MTPALLALVLSAPFPPQLGEPLDGAWVNGTRFYAWWDEWSDDAGVPEGQSRLEFRRFDGGYGVFDDTAPWSRGRYTTLTFPVENEVWCWRGVNINADGQASPPSDERCFRTDNTSPTSPGFVDAGAITSTGLVVIEHTAASDAVSGVAGYVLTLANDPMSSFFSEGSELVPGVPLVTYVGEGQWFGWVKVYDFADNSNDMMTGEYTIPIVVTAVDAGFVPARPFFETAVTSNYGDNLQWDAGAFALAGVTHVVSSHCNLETMCRWQHGFAGLPATQADGWLQLEGEGTMVARIAVVIGGQVGPWSAPSEPIIIDRTPPPRPTNVTAMPPITNVSGFTVAWYGGPDDRAGLDGFVIEELRVGDSARRTIEVTGAAMSRMVSPADDGRYEYRVRAFDRAGNGSDLSMLAATAVLDRGPPRLVTPVATATAFDGGAVVDLTWPLPTDELTAIVSQEVQESSSDGGQVVVPGTGTSLRRMVGVGRWTWRVRATDEAGNRSAFGPASNAIVVSPSGVAQGPALLTTGPFAAECGQPFTAILQASGDAPLTWTLLSGPPGFNFLDGLVSWIPPAGTSGTVNVEIKLQNAVDFVQRTLVFNVACAPASDAGTTTDGGGPNSTSQRRLLGLGCGCGSGSGSADALAVVLAALALVRRRRSRRWPGA